MLVCFVFYADWLKIAYCIEQSFVNRYGTIGVALTTITNLADSLWSDKEVWNGINFRKFNLYWKFESVKNWYNDQKSELSKEHPCSVFALKK